MRLRHLFYIKKKPCIIWPLFGESLCDKYVYDKKADVSFTVLIAPGERPRTPLKIKIKERHARRRAHLITLSSLASLFFGRFSETRIKFLNTYLPTIVAFSALENVANIVVLVGTCKNFSFYLLSDTLDKAHLVCIVKRECPPTHLAGTPLSHASTMSRPGYCRSPTLRGKTVCEVCPAPAPTSRRTCVRCGCRCPSLQGQPRAHH